MTEAAEQMGLRIVGLLVVVGFVSAAVLWTIDTSLSTGESLFAVYLSIDLIAFAMISYIYRVIKVGDNMRSIPLLAGCILLVVLAFASFGV